MKMKVAVIVFGLPPTRLGGTEIATQEIASRLARRHEVHVFTLGLPGEKNYEFRQGFHVHRLKTRWLYQLPFVDSLYYFEVMRALRKLRPNIIQIMGLRNRGSYGALISRILNIPFVLWDRGSINELGWPEKRTTAYFALKSAHTVIAQTEDMKKRMQAICKREVRVLGNGIDLQLFQGLDRERLREGLGLTGKRVVIYLGRLDPVKCVPDIIAAIALLRKRVKNLFFLMLGRGRQREEIAEMVREKGIGDITRMMGAVPHERVPEYLTASDAQVLVSWREGFPISVIEGMAAGLPLVVSDVAGLSEIVEDGVNGFVVPLHSPKEIADRLERLLTDKRLRQEISESNRKKAQDYSWKGIVRELEDIYRGAVE